MENYLERRPVDNELRRIFINLNEQQLLAVLATMFKGLPKIGTKLIGLVAGPGGGKGELTDNLLRVLDKSNTISTDDYVRGSRRYRRNKIESKGRDPWEKYNFEFMNNQVDAICNLKEGQLLGVPKYSEATGVAISKNPWETPDPATYSKKIGKVDFLIIEGDFLPLNPQRFDSVIYFDVPDEVRLANRIHRDLREGRETNEISIRENFLSRQATQFMPYTLPVRRIADVVIEVTATPLARPSDNRRFEYKYDVLQRG